MVPVTPDMLTTKNRKTNSRHEK